MLLSDKFSGACFPGYQAKPANVVFGQIQWCMVTGYQAKSANAAFGQIQWCMVYEISSQACQCCFRTKLVVHGLRAIKPSLPMLLLDKFSGAWLTGYQAKAANAAFGQI